MTSPEAINDVVESPPATVSSKIAATPSDAVPEPILVAKVDGDYENQRRERRERRKAERAAQKKVLAEKAIERERTHEKELAELHRLYQEELAEVNRIHEEELEELDRKHKEDIMGRENLSEKMRLLSQQVEMVIKQGSFPRAPFLSSVTPAMQASAPPFVHQVVQPTMATSSDTADHLRVKDNLPAVILDSGRNETEDMKTVAKIVTNIDPQVNLDHRPQLRAQDTHTPLDTDLDDEQLVDYNCDSDTPMASDAIANNPSSSAPVNSHSFQTTQASDSATIRETNSLLSGSAGGYAPTRFSSPYMMCTASDDASATIDFKQSNVEEGVVDSVPGHGPV